MSPRSAAIHELPISVKGVVANDAGKYLLGENPRTNGSCSEVVSSRAKTLVTRCDENSTKEAGIEVDVWPRPLGVYVFDVLKPQGRFVFIVGPSR